MININKCQNNNIVIYKSDFNYNWLLDYKIKIVHDISNYTVITNLITSTFTNQFTSIILNDVGCSSTSFNSTSGEILIKNSGFHTLYIFDDTLTNLIYQERLKVIDSDIYYSNEDTIIIFDNEEPSFCDNLNDCQSFKDLSEKVDNLEIGNDYTTAGLATVNYVDNAINNLPSSKDYTTAGLATIIYVDESINNLNIKDYTTAGLVKKVNNINPVSGNVTLTTSNISEGTNFYYTDFRVNNNANVIKGITAFNWGNHSTAGYVKKVNNILPISGNITLTTSNISEGTNFYYTDAKVNANANVIKGVTAFNYGNHSTTGYVKKVNNINPVSGNVTLTTSNISEGTNFYFTTSRVNNKFTKGGDIFTSEQIFGSTSGNFGIDLRTNGLTSVKFVASPTNAVNYTLVTVPSTATIRIGDIITGTGIPVNTYVITIMSSTTLSMSAIATSTNASFVLTITKPQVSKYISFTPNITNTKIGGLVLDNGATTTPNLTLCRNVQTNGSPYISILDSGNNNGNTYFNWLTVNTMFGGSGTVSPTSPSRIVLNLASNNNGAIYISNFANGIALNMSAGGMSISSNASTDEFRYNAVLQIGGVVGNSSYLNVSSNTLTNASTIVFNINNPSINNTTGTTTFKVLSIGNSVNNLQSSSTYDGYVFNTNIVSSAGTIYGVNFNPNITSSTGILAGYRMGMATGTNRYGLYFDGTAVNYLNGNTGIGTSTTNAILNLGASTTAKSSLNIPTGTAPTSPNNGDIWSDGTNLYMRIGGVTKTFVLL